MWPADPGGAEMAPMPVAPPSPPSHEPEATPPAETVAVVDPAPSPRSAQPAAADVSAPSRTAEPQPNEVDLSGVLQDLRRQPSPAADAPIAIENVLQGLRDEGANDASPETAEQHFKMAATYVDMGMQEEAMKALEAAARSPRHRFRAGAMLAKACLDAGDPVRAIEWYERAVEAPAPSPMAHHALLYELASVLEANGEGARALAVLLELQSEAGEYRDVSTRLEQLKVQIGS
jgi:tetratricopeptide (TPR) repeat protein